VPSSINSNRGHLAHFPKSQTSDVGGTVFEEDNKKPKLFNKVFDMNIGDIIRGNAH
jgi:hypothetical protein